MKHTIAEIQVSYNPKRLKNELKITSSDKAYRLLMDEWDTGTIELYEEFKIILLNNSNEPLGIYNLSKGGINFTSVDVRIMFAVILKCGASAFITVHNHPSGKLQPSQPDKDIHKKIEQIAKFHDLNYLDNLIITKRGYFSFRDEGL